MKRKLFFLYIFIGITILLSSAKLLRGNHLAVDDCTKTCVKCDQKKTEKAATPELFSPLHFITILN